MNFIIKYDRENCLRENGYMGKLTRLLGCRNLRFNGAADKGSFYVIEDGLITNCFEDEDYELSKWNYPVIRSTDLRSVLDMPIYEREDALVSLIINTGRGVPMKNKQSKPKQPEPQAATVQIVYTDQSIYTLRRVKSAVISEGKLTVMYSTCKQKDGLTLSSDVQAVIDTKDISSLGTRNLNGKKSKWVMFSQGEIVAVEELYHKCDKPRSLNLL